MGDRVTVPAPGPCFRLPSPRGVHGGGGQGPEHRQWGAPGKAQVAQDNSRQGCGERDELERRSAEKAGSRRCSELRKGRGTCDGSGVEGGHRTHCCPRHFSPEGDGEGGCQGTRRLRRKDAKERPRVSPASLLLLQREFLNKDMFGGSLGIRHFAFFR